MESLLWRLADRFAPAESSYPHVVRPEWFDHAGDLVVANGPVSWETPWYTEGGFRHSIPAGKHPVYVGTYADIRDSSRPDASRYFASLIVIPLAEPAQVVDATWDVEGYDDIHLIEDYAILWGEEAMRASLPFDDGSVPHFFPAVRDAILGKGPYYRRDNWADIVLDAKTGANAFVFPVSAGNVSGYEIVEGEYDEDDIDEDDDRTLLCLVLTACYW